MKTFRRAALTSLFCALGAGMCLAAGVAVTFAPASYLDHVKFLASDELEGRGPGTPGIERAAEYIADQFKQAGLQPGGVDGTWFQPFTIAGRKKFESADASLKIAGVEGDWKVGEDWTPLPFTKLGDIEGPLAFAGYGISTEEEHYDDYKDLDVKGKVVLIFRYEPKAADSDADFGGETPSTHSLFSAKAADAATAGASALLIVNPPNRDPDKDELYEWTSRDARMTYGVPMVHISRRLADAILKAAEMPDTKALATQIDADFKPRSAELKNLTATIKTGVSQPDIPARNVIGLLPAVAPSDEYVVVGAHFDHLGKVARYSDPDGEAEIHNGADDNASGTAGVLELAKAFGHAIRPRRNILFMAFSGEERGLLGSKHYAEHPTVPLAQIRAMYNLDMIGRYSNEKFSMWGIASGAEFEDIVRSAALSENVKYGSESTSSSLFGASDHYSFYKKNIPVLFACTEVHPQYHKPEDDWELVDAPGAAQILSMSYRIIDRLANMESGPTFVPRDQEKGREQQAATSQASGDEPRMPRARLGIVPAYNDTKPGLLIDMVNEGGAAKAAGMKDGDRITQIGEQAVGDITGYMEIMQKYRPGDTMTVVVERGGEKITLTIELKATPRGRS